MRLDSLIPDVDQPFFSPPNLRLGTVMLNPKIQRRCLEWTGLDRSELGKNLLSLLDCLSELPGSLSVFRNVYTSKAPHLFFSLSLSSHVLLWFLWNEMSKNGEGWRGIYRSCLPIRMSHPIACVSSCMLSVACVATHGRPHALLHASFTCQETPPRPHSSQHVWGSSVATHGHLHVGSHAQIVGIATPRVSVCRDAWNCFMHVYTSFLC
ncbi:hypothetical protein F2Q68_00016317 [Brassica cretica]|uniref:Uncharacterized protein n=1 Tax=Brassica cretica TaxID=69181 RepID=A0A8S9HID7_BRACR|nr:hypothetical protein F2Q68_00016317 [Brassica cretica]